LYVIRTENAQYKTPNEMPGPDLQGFKNLEGLFKPKPHTITNQKPNETFLLRGDITTQTESRAIWPRITVKT
jgi:hypothetical protein